MQVGLCLYKMSEMMKNVLVAMGKIVLLRIFFFKYFHFILLKSLLNKFKLKLAFIWIVFECITSISTCMTNFFSDFQLKIIKKGDNFSNLLQKQIKFSTQFYFFCLFLDTPFIFSA